MPHTVLDAGGHPWEERAAIAGGAPRRYVDVTTAAGLAESRARLWRLPPNSRGRRHIEHAQEEVFVVLDGTVTLLLGEPPERVELGPQSIVAVKPGTAIQVRNESGAELTLFVYGAPPVAGRAELLDGLEPASG